MNKITYSSMYIPRGFFHKFFESIFWSLANEKCCTYLNNKSSKISFLFHLIIVVEQNLVICSIDVMILLLSHLELKSQYQCLIFVLL